MIYTSYFARYQNPKALPEDIKEKFQKLRGMSIALRSPSWFKGEYFRFLAPSENLLHQYKKKLIDAEEYERLYYLQIADLNAAELRKRLDKSILLCWEKPNLFCHRHLVAKWLHDKTGTTVKEI